MTKANMQSAVLVLGWNGGDDLLACLAAVTTQQGASAQVLLVDNGSVDGSPASVRQRFPQVQVVENGRNLGFSAGMNVGLRLLMAAQPRPDVIVLLNQDTVVAPEWLAAILKPFDHDPQIGVVGCKIYYPDGHTIQHAGKWLEPGRAVSRHIGHGELDQGQFDTPGEAQSVTGAALALRVTALDAVGLFDEGYSPAYFEDDDLCWRMRRAGFRVYYQPAATLRHAESRSTADVIKRSTLMNRNRLRFVVKTYPADQVFGDFVLAEQVRLAVLPEGGELRTLRRAYLEGMVQIEEWIAARREWYPVSEEEAHRLRGLCHLLRTTAAAADRERMERVTPGA